MSADPIEEAALDPYNVAAYRAKPPQSMITSSEMTALPARRPDRKEFFRINPNEELILDTSIVEHSLDDGREISYLVPPHAQGILPDDEKAARLFVCINRHGSLFVWPCLLGNLDNEMSMTWANSRLQAADAAMHGWVKMQSGGYGAGYTIIRPRGELPDPVWPSITMGDVLRKAYPADRVITSADHPVVRDIEGA